MSVFGGPFDVPDAEDVPIFAFLLGALGGQALENLAALGAVGHGVGGEDPILPEAAEHLLGPAKADAEGLLHVIDGNVVA